MEFLIVDTRSAYHGVLGRPTLKDLHAVISIHNMAIKFPMPGGVAKVRRNQTETRACYMNALRKVAKREDIAPAVMTIHSEPMDLDHREPDEKMILDEGLDPRIIGSDSLASPVEELEAFPVNSSEEWRNSTRLPRPQNPPRKSSTTIQTEEWRNSTRLPGRI
ncbi:Uncharacterized protein Adt_02428 [Abeliophyllum distichum]|uniref:Uncharacterized protein n=1 Tax=Abeliophyllum distichum TaxID=126358 RepID=A0ABD1VVY6_9LAMI